MITLDQYRPPALLAAETEILTPFAEKLRGYYLLLFGNHRKCSELPPHTLRAFNLSPRLPADIISDYDQLPLRNNNIDAVILPYLLEYCQNPLELLKETCRSLTGEGKLLIFGFQRIHPWCWFNTPKPVHLLSLFKIKSLLKQAGLSVVSLKHCYYNAVYFIEAQKHVHLITPIRFEWQPPSFEKTWAKPAARQINRNSDDS